MECIIFTGAQGAGKTSFFKQHFIQTHLRISLDLLNTRNKEKIFITTCFNTGQRFVIDNTNPGRDERTKYIAWAKEFKFKVISYYFDCPLDDCIERNSGRTGKEKIPLAGVHSTYRKLEKPLPEEGFDEMFEVKLESNAFIVQKVLCD